MDGQTDTYDRIQFLHEICLILSSGSQLSDKFEQILGKLVDVSGCHAASIFLADRQTGELVESVSYGARVDLVEGFDCENGQGYNTWIAQQERAVLIPLPCDGRNDFSSCVSAPLKINNTLVGVINLGLGEAESLSEEILRLIGIIAGELAFMIDRVRYESELVEANRALKSAETEIKKQQARIIEMEKYHVMAQMAASINHEINNPLTTILGNAELVLMMHSDLSEEVRVKLEKIVTEARRISSITEKLRNMKRAVSEEYLARTSETMVDIDSSSIMQENNSREGRLFS